MPADLIPLWAQWVVVWAAAAHLSMLAATAYATARDIRRRKRAQAEMEKRIRRQHQEFEAMLQRYAEMEATRPDTPKVELN